MNQRYLDYQESGARLLAHPRVYGVPEDQCEQVLNGKESQAYYDTLRDMMHNHMVWLLTVEPAGRA